MLDDDANSTKPTCAQGRRRRAHFWQEKGICGGARTSPLIATLLTAPWKLKSSESISGVADDATGCTQTTHERCSGIENPGLDGEANRDAVGRARDTAFAAVVRGCARSL